MAYGGGDRFAGKHAARGEHLERVGHDRRAAPAPAPPCGAVRVAAAHATSTMRSEATSDKLGQRLLASVMTSGSALAIA
jgi:hypothetical protein